MARPGGAKTPSALQATFASPAMARLLLFFAVHPEEALHIRELYRRTGLGMASLQKELERFQRLGIVEKRAQGRKVVYRLNLASERWRAMRALVRKLADPSEILREAFTGGAGGRGGVRLWIAGARRDAAGQRRRPPPGGG